MSQWVKILNAGSNICSPIVNTQNWQLLQKLTGDSAGDQFGESVAMNKNGTILLMGSVFDDEGGNNAGAALVYTGSATAGWQLRQKLTGDSVNDRYGLSVDVNSDGNLLMMGGIFDNDGGASAGAALVYTGSATAGWRLRQKLTGIHISGRYGTSVATNSDGTVLMMGGYSGRGIAGGTIVNSTLIYTGNSIAGWGSRQILTGHSANVLFGMNAVTNNSGTVLMMAGSSSDINNRESVLIYTGNSIAGWQFRQRVTGEGGSGVYSSLATNGDGNILMIGGYSLSSAGGCTVHTGNSVAGWQLAQILTGDSFNDGYFWVDTNNDGTVLVMGGSLDDASLVNDNAGAALVYTGSATNGWRLQQKLTGNNPGGEFGYGVAISNDGTVLMSSSIIDMNMAGSALVYSPLISSPSPSNCLKITNVGGNICAPNSQNCIKINDVRKI